MPELLDYETPSVNGQDSHLGRFWIIWAILAPVGVCLWDGITNEAAGVRYPDGGVFMLNVAASIVVAVWVGSAQLFTTFTWPRSRITAVVAALLPGLLLLAFFEIFW